MEPAVRAEHTEDVLEGVSRVVGGPVRLLGGFESFIYETKIDGAPRIVKATWHERRTPEQMLAELHFVNYLADGGAPVCRGLPLADRTLVGTVRSAAGAFHVCSFAKAPGTFLTRNTRTDAHWIRWGVLVGQLHRLSATYPGPPPPFARPSWETEYDSFAPFTDNGQGLRRAFEQSRADIEALPRDPGSFGAIHTDLHNFNIFWTGLEPHVFDFDDMLEFWFISDLAIVLYYALRDPVWHENDRQADFERLRELVWQGYGTEHALPGWSYDALPLFMALREQTLLAVIARSIPESDRGPRWQKFFEEATERVKDGRPALDLRF